MLRICRAPFRRILSPEYSASHNPEEPGTLWLSHYEAFSCVVVPNPSWVFIMEVILPVRDDVPSLVQPEEFPLAQETDIIPLLIIRGWNLIRE